MGKSEPSTSLYLKNIRIASYKATKREIELPFDSQRTSVCRKKLIILHGCLHKTVEKILF